MEGSEAHAQEAAVATSPPAPSPPGEGEKRMFKGIIFKNEKDESF